MTGRYGRETGLKNLRRLRFPQLPEVAEAGLQRGFDQLLPAAAAPGASRRVRWNRGRRGEGAPPYGVVFDSRPVGATCGRPPSIPRHCEPVRTLARRSVPSPSAVTGGRMVSAPTNAPGKHPVPPTGPPNARFREMTRRGRACPARFPAYHMGQTIRTGPEAPTPPRYPNLGGHRRAATGRPYGVRPRSLL